MSKKLSYADRFKIYANLQANLVDEMDSQPNDWSEVEVDTLIMVRNKTNGDWSKKYFKHYNIQDNKIATWNNGQTSKTARENGWSEFDYGMLIKEEGEYN